MINTLKYARHEIGNILPELDAEEKRKLTEDIKRNGLIEPVVLYEGKILDGFNRAKACMSAGVEPKFIEFDKMNGEIKAAGPVAYVLSKNLIRRHLNAGQRATVAADALPYYEREAAKRQKASLKQNRDKAPTGANGEVKGKAATQAAKTTGASTRSVERAKHLKRKHPKKFEKVKRGEMTLGEATRDKKREAAEAKRALKLSKGLTDTNTIGQMFAATKQAGGKLTFTIDIYKVTVKMKKAKKAKAAKRK